ncbi:MAG: hypothetical protein H6963_14205 [Chromatiaceae bacterium]|nr:hypothetical protein [Chromatiaceae bacterium]
MKLSNIEGLIECDGQIIVGYMNPVGYVAVANDEHNTLAMLKRRPEESFMDLLQRLDQAIERAIEHEEYIDEINS